MCLPAVEVNPARNLPVVDQHEFWAPAVPKDVREGWTVCSASRMAALGLGDLHQPQPFRATLFPATDVVAVPAVAPTVLAVRVHV